MKFCYITVLTVFFSVLLSGIDVDKEELDIQRDKAIEFINYTGPHSYVNTIEEILDIGRGLGKRITNKYGEFGYSRKYRVIHAVDPRTEEALDADIFIIDKAARVDHIFTLKLMIRGYLRSAYGYSGKDAATLTEFIVYYNAVFRNDIEYLGTKYKKIVMDNLSKENAGLSLLYSDWPGKSRIVIPLSEMSEKGTLSSLKSDELTDKKVIDELRKEEDMAVEPRKEIVELKEKEIEQKQDDLKKEKDTAEAELEEAKEEKEKIAEEKEKIEKELSDPTVKNKTELEKKKEVLEKQEAAADKKIEEKTEKVEALSEEEKKLKEREKAVSKERDQIARDKQDIINNEESRDVSDKTSASSGGRLVYLYINSSGSGRLYLIDDKSGNPLLKSAIDTVHERKYERIGNDLVIIAGNSKSGANLYVIDSSTLEQKIKGADSIYGKSILFVSGSSIFAIVSKNGKTFLGKFDAGLNLVLQSEVGVFGVTTMEIKSGKLYIQEKGGNILVLSASDLKKVE